MARTPARQINRFALLAIGVFAVFLLRYPTAAADAPPSRPQRIVSTNYCTDQILLRLVEPERIASLTYLSWKPDQTAPEFQPILRGLKKNHGLAEEVMRLKPDLVLGGEFSARFSNALLQRLGYKLYLIKTQNTFGEWYASVLEIGDALGEPERARKLVLDFKSRLAALEAKIPPGERPLYADLAVNYNYPGKDTLYSELVKAGGFKTIGEALDFNGYRTVPLEKLIRLDAALISSRTQYEKPPSLATRNLQHPLLRRMEQRAFAAIDIPPRYVACTTPETLKMVETLVQARRDFELAKATKGDWRAGRSK